MITTFATTPATKSGSNTGLIVLGIAAALGLGYYFLVYKPEQDKLAQNGK